MHYRCYCLQCNLYYLNFSYVIIIFTLIFLSLSFKVKPTKSPDDIQAKVNRVFRVMSGILAIYTFISFFKITYISVNKFWENSSEIYSNILSNPDDENSVRLVDDEELFMKVFVLIVFFCNLGMITILTASHIVGMPSLIWYILQSLLSFLFYSSTYGHTLVIFAFCNIDDVTCKI